MEVLMFLTHVPRKGEIGPWLPIERRAGNAATTLSVTAFRPGRIDKRELSPICGEIEWSAAAVDRSDRVEAFSGGMVDVLLRLNAPAPRIRFNGEGVDGADLRVVIQLRDVDADR